MSLAARTLWTVRRYWTDRLGVPIEAFETPGVTVGVADEGGVQLFCRDDSIVVGTPESLADAVERNIGGAATLNVNEGTAVREWFDAVGSIERVVGPTFYGYTDRETFTPGSSDARLLAVDDESTFAAFRATIPADEWDRGGPAFTPGETVGLFVDGELVAVAGDDVWDGLLAHLSVVVHPDHRGNGYGRAVVSRATERTLSSGLLPQYRTSDAWPWSVALARKLGFERFATAYLGIHRSAWIAYQNRR